jgi:E3 ubiquitin-protein ligase TRIP12
VCSPVAAGSAAGSRSLGRSFSAGSYGGSTLSSGLAALMNPFKIRLEKHGSERALREYSSHYVLIEPLASLTAVEDFLWSKVRRAGGADCVGCGLVVCVQRGPGWLHPAELLHLGARRLLLLGACNQHALLLSRRAPTRQVSRGMAVPELEKLNAAEPAGAASAAAASTSAAAAAAAAATAQQQASGGAAAAAAAAEAAGRSATAPVPTPTRQTRASSRAQPIPKSSAAQPIPEDAAAGGAACCLR